MNTPVLILQGYRERLAGRGLPLPLSLQVKVLAKLLPTASSGCKSSESENRQRKRKNFSPSLCQTKMQSGEKVQKPAGFAHHLHFAREIFLPICLIEMRSHFHGQNLNRHSALLENRAGKVGVTKVKARERGSEKLPEIMA